MLLDRKAPARPTLRLRRRLHRAIRREPFCPEQVEGITIIPLAFFQRTAVVRLIEQAAICHRQARVAV